MIPAMPFPARERSRSPVPTPVRGGVQNRSALISTGAVRGLLAALAAAVLLSVLLGPIGRVEPAPGGWLEGVPAVLAAGTVLVSLARRLPVQNAVACGLVLLLTSGMALAVAAHTRFPLGHFEFTGALGWRFLGLVSWPVGFLWVAVLLSSRQSAKVMLRPWRRRRHYGWLLLAVSVVLSVGLTAVVNPFGHRVKGWWMWRPPADSLTWYGAPLALLPAAAVLGGGLLLCATPWLIPKRSTGQPPELEPVAVWVVLATWPALGCLRAGLIGPAALGLGGAALVAGLAWWGQRATVTPAAAAADAPASAG
jgi:uncharacterized membrane protein